MLRERPNVCSNACGILLKVQCTSEPTRVRIGYTQCNTIWIWNIGTNLIGDKRVREQPTTTGTGGRSTFDPQPMPSLAPIRGHEGYTASDKQHARARLVPGAVDTRARKLTRADSVLI